MFGRKYPWNFIKRKIDKVFIESAFPGQKDKVARPAEEWAHRDRVAREKHPFLTWVDNFLLHVEIRIEKIWEFITYPRLYYCNAIRDKTHIIPTGLKKGQWHDASERLFHGMMELVVFFVEQENKYYFDRYKENTEEEEENVEEQDLEEFLNVFQANLNEVDRQSNATMDEWLEVYDWYKNIYPTYEKKYKELYAQMPDMPKEWSVMEVLADEELERKAIRLKLHTEIWALEKKEQKEKMEMMQKVIDNYEGMWS